MKLIDEWRSAYKMFSVQAMALATAMLGAWVAIPDDQKAWFPSWVQTAFHVAAIVVLLGGLCGRMLKQSDPDATQRGVK